MIPEEKQGLVKWENIKVTKNSETWDLKEGKS